MQTRNFDITTRTTRVLTFALCDTSTASFQCTSFPVFARATNDGTARYSLDTPLKQLSPAGSFRSANNPSVSYHAASGTGTITFVYGNSFSTALKEYEASSTPQRYKYFLHLTGASPGTAYSDSFTANSSMILGGTINVFVPGNTVTAIVDVCTVEVQ